MSISSDGASVYCPAPAGCIFLSPQPAELLPVPLTVTQAGSVLYDSLNILGTTFFYEVSTGTWALPAHPQA